MKKSHWGALTARMGANEIVELQALQRAFFRSGATRELSFRRDQLKGLKEAIKQNETEILGALKADLNKPAFEAYGSEIGFLYEEIHTAKKHLENWAADQAVPTPFVYWMGRSFVHVDPLGVVLIIGPWNYPFQLVISPLVGAIAAGNCAVLKPSEIAPHTSTAIANMLKKAFEPKYIAVIEGGVETSQSLLAERWDHIFYTGGEVVGRIVMTAAAKYLTPVTLELGGKSPCIVDSDTDIDITARRMVWGKFFNAGQTCVAPDYVLVQRSVKQHLLERIKHYIGQYFGPDPLKSPDYARIINAKHFQRLQTLLTDGTIVTGGKSLASELYIAPTVMDNISVEDRVMAEEIFGPILPVLEYEDFEGALDLVNQRPEPLALYFFSKNKEHQERIIREVAFGGGCINDTLVHLGNPHLPFGGVGKSGMGAYHGKFSFDTFSRKKGIVIRSLKPDIKLRYPPYQGKMKFLKWFMR